MAETTSAASNPPQEEKLGFAGKVNKWIEDLAINGIREQQSDGIRKLQEKLAKAGNPPQEQPKPEGTKANGGLVASENDTTIVNLLFNNGRIGPKEEKRMSEATTAIAPEAGKSEAPATGTAPQSSTSETTARMSENAREAYNKTQEAIVEKVAIGLKKDGNIVDLATKLGGAATMELPQSDEEYRRIARELIQDRKFTYKTYKDKEEKFVEDEDGNKAVVTIEKIDTKLKLLKAIDPEKHKEVTEKIGADTLGERIPDAKRSSNIAKAVSEGVEENSGIGSKIMTFLFALVQWIGGGFQDNLFSIMANLSADKIVKSTDEKLRAINEDPKTIQEVSENVRLTVLKKAEHPDPKAKTERLEDIPNSGSPAETPAKKTPSEPPIEPGKGGGDTQKNEPVSPKKEGTTTSETDQVKPSSNQEKSSIETLKIEALKGTASAAALIAVHNVGEAIISPSSNLGATLIAVQNAGKATQNTFAESNPEEALIAFNKATAAQNTQAQSNQPPHVAASKDSTPEIRSDAGNYKNANATPQGQHHTPAPQSKAKHNQKPMQQQATTLEPSTVIAANYHALTTENTGLSKEALQIVQQIENSINNPQPNKQYLASAQTNHGKDKNVAHNENDKSNNQEEKLGKTKKENGKGATEHPKGNGKKSATPPVVTAHKDAEPVKPPAPTLPASTTHAVHEPTTPQVALTPPAETTKPIIVKSKLKEEIRRIADNTLPKNLDNRDNAVEKFTNFLTAAATAPETKAAVVGNENKNVFDKPVKLTGEILTKLFAGTDTLANDSANIMRAYADKITRATGGVVEINDKDIKKILEDKLQAAITSNKQNLINASKLDDVARSEGKELAKAGLSNANATYLAAAKPQHGSQQMGLS